MNNVDTIFIFYWFAWLCWVSVTFFMNKGRIRSQWMVILLLAILSANQHFFLFGFHIHVSLLFFLGLGFYFLVRKELNDLVYLCFSSLVIAIGYVALYLFSVYDPVWLMLSFQWVSTAYFIVLCLLLLSTLIDRFICLFISISIGEITFGLILFELGLHNEIGMNDFLIRLTLTSIGLLFFAQFERILAALENYIYKLKEERNKVI